MTRLTIAMTGRARRAHLAALLAAVLVGLLAMPASASAAPALDVTASHFPSVVPTGTYVQYTLGVSNTGSTDTSGNVSVTLNTPPGLEVTSVTDEVKKQFNFPSWGCTIAGDAQSVTCSGPSIFGPLPIESGKEACEGAFGGAIAHCRILVMAKVGFGVPAGTVLTPTVEACGGGASSCPAVAASASDPTEVVPLDFHLTSFDGKILQENGDPATQAGSHPYTASSEFHVSTALGANGTENNVQDIKDATVSIPPGLVGNPQAIPTCSEEQLEGGNFALCPAEAQVGTITLWLNGDVAPAGHPQPGTIGVYNMPAPHGTPAVFGMNIGGVPVHVYARVRSGGDYGIVLAAKNAAETLPFGGVTFAFWGVPADPSHDSQRFCPAAQVPGCTSSAPLQPFVTLPTSCVGLTRFDLTATGWQGGEDSASFLTHDNTLPVPTPIGNDGCNGVDFSPTLEARPTTSVADSASGLDVDLHIPQHESCDPGPPVSCENAEAHLRDATVTLPQGLVVNPSGANGLDGCSLGELGYTGTDPDGTIHTTADPASCPDASKQGRVTVETPLLDHPLQGAVYLADPFDNPFDSLLALYIAVDDEETGVVVKLAGEVEADPQTGQLKATFKQNPQLPFEHFRLHFFGGAAGPLRTPATCGTYLTTSILTPWTAPESGPLATPSDAWAIQTAPGGGACPTSKGALPNSPDLDAGSASPVAGSSTPTVVTLRRNDGSQEFSTVDLKLPPGLTGKLAGLGQCSDAALASAASKTGNAEKASPSCPSSSRIGSVDVTAGAGPAPYSTQGLAYLTGPYKGAPLGMAIVTPATAGPFDLGTVVVRIALFVDRNTAQITAVSDPIPSILQGIPLDVRSASVKLDRPDFTRNGTSCDPSSFDGSLVSTLGQSASLSERFQLGECSSLAFKPKLSIRLKGGTKRGGHPALIGILTMPQGGANVAKASVALPKSEFLDQSHIGTVCTRVQFAAKECPAASIYGRATATSPLVDYAVSGPVYLRSSDNKLPDLVMAFKGPAHQPIEVDAVARIDSVKGGIRSTFEGVPDLPLSRVVLEMQGGKKGLLENSRNICATTYRATAELDGQNGKIADLKPVLKNAKCGKKGRSARKGKRRRSSR